MDGISPVAAQFLLLGVPAFVALTCLVFFLYEDHQKAKKKEAELKTKAPSVSTAKIKVSKKSKKDKKRGRIRWV